MSTAIWSLILQVKPFARYVATIASYLLCASPNPVLQRLRLAPPSLASSLDKGEAGIRQDDIEDRAMLRGHAPFVEMDIDTFKDVFFEVVFLSQGCETKELSAQHRYVR